MTTTNDVAYDLFTARSDESHTYDPAGRVPSGRGDNTSTGPRYAIVADRYHGAQVGWLIYDTTTGETVDRAVTRGMAERLLAHCLDPLNVARPAESNAERWAGWS